MKKLAVMALVCMLTMLVFAPVSYAGKKPRGCRLPDAATDVMATVAGSHVNVAWVNNYVPNPKKKEGGRVVVQRSYYVKFDFYGSPLYHYWTPWESSLPLSLTTTALLDTPTPGYPLRYRVVTYNVCGDAVASEEVEIP
jgi:hypothetical protein